MLKNNLIKILSMVVIFIILIIGMQTLSMAATFSVNAAKSTLDEGANTKLTINASGCLGKFSISSSDSNIVSVSESSKWIEDTSASITLTAKKAGKATITVTATNVSDVKGDNDVTGSKSTTITVSAPKIETPSDVKDTTNNNKSNSENKPNTSSSKSSDATLKTLTIGGKNYTNPKTDITAPSVNANTSSIKISAIANDSKATISGTGTKDLLTGTNKFTIKVKAENGNTKSYVVRVTRLAEESTTPNVLEEKKPISEEVEQKKIEEQPQELRLTSLVINETELIPEFSSELFEYSAYVNDIDEIKIDAIANNEDAKVEITGNTELVEGENIATVKLTKDDKTVEYKIKINKSIVMVQEEIQEEPEEQKEEETKKIGIIGIINNWWISSGSATIAFSTILILLGAAIIFAITTYKYGNNLKKISKQDRVESIEKSSNQQ